jgi:uncharacterized protein (DUF302 family)
MILAVDSEKPLAAIREDLPRACAAHRFGVLGVHDLRAKLREKGVEYARESLVFEVCNPHQAKRILEANPEVATVLPCRIAAYPTPDGKTRLATLLPTELVAIFGGSPELRDAAVEVEAALGAILREASGR